MSSGDQVQNIGPEQRYHAFLDNNEFRIQHCGHCNTHIFFPRAICPECGETDALQWVVPSGRGTVYSTTVVCRKPEQGGDYNVALIDLNEGPRMMSRVDGLPPEQVRIGMEVRAKIIEEGGEKIVVFTSAEEQQ